MEEMLNNIAKRMITKIRVVNLYTKDSEAFDALQDFESQDWR